MVKGWVEVVVVDRERLAGFNRELDVNTDWDADWDDVWDDAVWDVDVTDPSGKTAFSIITRVTKALTYSASDHEYSDKPPH